MCREYILIKKIQGYSQRMRLKRRPETKFDDSGVNCKSFEHNRFMAYSMFTFSGNPKYKETENINLYNHL